MNWNRREFLRSAAAAVPAAAQPRQRPNILLVISDQQHWRAAGFMDRFFETPALDALARQSVVFENSFCTTPQCSASRSSIFTGLYPSRTRVYGNMGAPGGNPLTLPTFAPALQKAGYRTAYFGKWHLGREAAANAGWHEEMKQERDQEVTRRALDFLARAAKERPNEPWAMVLCYLNPHDVYHFKPESTALGVPMPVSFRRERFENKPSIQKQFMTEDQGQILWGRDEPHWQAYREFYKSRVRLFDAELGKVLAAVQDTSNTVVVATSDHGDMDTEHKLIFKGPFCYEHMMRVPLVIRMPGVAPRRETGFDAVNVDLAPTIAELAGATLSPGLDGQSLLPLLTGTGAKPSRPFVIGQYYGKQNWVNPIRMLRTREFKYNLHVGHGEELYDLRNDPHELRNLAGEAGFAARKRELNERLRTWMKEHDDPFHSFTPTRRDGSPWVEVAHR